jgi:hypothetical protein
MNRIIFLLAPLMLTACVDGDSSTTGPKSERIYTVDEFLARPDLRKKFFALCGNDPGQNERDPNCINVVSAERIASAGTTIPSRIR